MERDARRHRGAGLRGFDGEGGEGGCGIKADLWECCQSLANTNTVHHVAPARNYMSSHGISL